MNAQDYCVVIGGVNVDIFAKKDETLYEALNRLEDIRKKIPARKN